MFGINKYLIGGVAIAFLLLSGTAYFFYKDSQQKLVQITLLKEENSRLNLIIKNRDAQIELNAKDLKIKEELLKSNREEIEAKQQQLKDIETLLENEKGVNDDAAPSLKKLFESLAGRK